MILDSIRQGVQQDYSGGVGKVPETSINPAASIDISDTRISSTVDDSALLYNKKTLMSTMASPLQASPSLPADDSLLKEPLRHGMGGDKVTRFQKALKLAVPLEVTGTFDDATTEAVKKFQGMKGLGQDGVVGNITFAHLWADNFWNKGIVSDLRGPEFYACMPQDMEIQVSIKTQRAYLMDSHSGEVVREYPVATGKSPYNTPTGSYRITEIKEKPSWYPPKSGWAKGASVAKPGPGNPLGPVKMRLGDTSVLFHGVPPHEYSSIGKRPASHGCMRMFPQDAWELHTLIKSGTRVTISK